MSNAILFGICLVCAVIHSAGSVSSTTKAGESTGEIPHQGSNPHHGSNGGKKKRETCTASAYRTADGTCNNEANTLWGSTDQPFERSLNANYDDGEKLPRAKTSENVDLPNPRLISNKVHFHLNFTAFGSTAMMMEWGQFLAHDIVYTPVMDHIKDCCDGSNDEDYLTGGECFPIMIPDNDIYFTRTCMNFTRSQPAHTGTVDNSPRNQYNAITAFIDASNVYGSSIDQTATLRDTSGGLLKVETNDLLPNLDENDCELDPTDSADYCFTAGDERVNVFPGLNALHTLFMREHNRIAKELAGYNSAWDDEKLFQEARKIVGAEMQVITYRHWLPRVIGQSAMSDYNLNQGNHVYDSTVNPTLVNVFATAAFRFGHTMIPEVLGIGDKDYELVDLFNRPKFVRDSLDDVVNGLLTTLMQRVDAWYVEGMTNHLFETGNSNGLDIAALNIQRGRDHGIPTLNEWRTYCGLENISNFTTGFFTNRAGRDLATVYASPDDVDLYSGGVSEVSVSDGSVGPTYACLIAEQFKKLKEGDRYFYETTDTTTGFTDVQLRQLKKVSLSKVICDNTQITKVQSHAFGAVGDNNLEFECSDTSVRQMDLSKWKE